MNVSAKTEPATRSATPFFDFERATRSRQRDKEEGEVTTLARHHYHYRKRNESESASSSSTASLTPPMNASLRTSTRRFYPSPLGGRLLNRQDFKAVATRSPSLATSAIYLRRWSSAKDGKNQTGWYAGVGSVPLLLSSGAAVVAMCDKEDQLQEVPSLWSDGIQAEDGVDAVVAEILNDPSIHLSMIPDAIERRIYKSTIQLTLNIFHSLLTSLNGSQLLSHEIRIHHKSADLDRGVLAATIRSSSRLVNDKVLEQVADRLLANRAIDSSFVPDAVERQIYVNCLKVIFRVLLTISQSFCITICGHELRLQLTPMNVDSTAYATAVEQALVTSSLSTIDMKLLRDFALQSGISEETPVELSWWDSLFVSRQFVAQLHTSLYGLLWGVVDDIMAHTNIQILSDQLSFDIVPSTAKVAVSGYEQSNDETPAPAASDGLVGVGSFAVASFGVGVGVGVTLMALLVNKK
jgi:hypothetical protein